MANVEKTKEADATVDEPDFDDGDGGDDDDDFEETEVADDDGSFVPESNDEARRQWVAGFILNSEYIAPENWSRMIVEMAEVIKTGRVRSAKISKLSVKK